MAGEGGVCVYTPESFVEVLISGLNDAVAKVHATSDVQTLLIKAITGDFEHILIHSEALSRAALASLVVKIRNRNPKVNIFLLEGSAAPELHRIHPTALGEPHPSVKLVDLNFARIIDVIRSGFEVPGKAKEAPEIKLTKRQWAVLECVGEGLSNAEIARKRNCTPRAVETILNRTMERLGIDSTLSSRGRTVAVLKFLESVK